MTDGGKHCPRCGSFVRIVEKPWVAYYVCSKCRVAGDWPSEEN